MPAQICYPVVGDVYRPAGENSPSPVMDENKIKSIEDVMAKAKFVVIEYDYSNTVCKECGSGERPEELLLCDKCNTGLHLGCARPVVARVPTGNWFCPSCSGLPMIKKSFSQKKILDFFRIKKDTGAIQKFTSAHQDSKKRRRRPGTLVCYKKKKRRLLPYVPSEDPVERLAQMRSLASALSANRMEFCDDLSYVPGLAPKSTNRAELEVGGMQVLSKEDFETVEKCKDMARRGECPPLRVVYDTLEGHTVEADGPIKDMTYLGEYGGDVDFIKNHEQDDCDSLMTLLLAFDQSESLLICPDKRGNIGRFFSGINNFAPKSKKKLNVKSVRYSVNGECRVFMVATRDIAKGERLYYDYNGVLGGPQCGLPWQLRSCKREFVF